MDFRRGVREDEDWLYRLFRDTMQPYIDAAWGWDELLQREGFLTSLPAPNFVILCRGKKRLGCYHLSRKPDHLLLDIIMVPRALQGQGHGRRMMEQIKSTARATGLPVRLSVLQTNPAVRFHLHLGFGEYERDAHSLKLNWVPQPPCLNLRGKFKQGV